MSNDYDDDAILLDFAFSENILKNRFSVLRALEVNVSPLIEVTKSRLQHPGIAPNLSVQTADMARPPIVGYQLHSLQTAVCP
jgi:hypothetical protein